MSDNSTTIYFLQDIFAQPCAIKIGQQQVAFFEIIIMIIITIIIMIIIIIIIMITVMIIVIVVGALGVILKQFGNRLKQIGITAGTAQVQDTVLLGTAKILRNVLEI